MSATESERALVVLASDAPEEARIAAHRLRLYVDIAVADVSELSDLGGNGSHVVVRRPFEAVFSPFHGTDLDQWLRVQAVALVANTSTLEDDEPYHDLGLPVARLFVNGSSLDTVARATVRTLATKFEGRVAFMERNATAKSYDWRQHGLPGRFPSFAVAASMEHNATRYAFLEPSYGQEEFWSTAVDTLSTFLEEAIAGQLRPSFSSQEPPDDNLTLPIGAIRTLVGRRCRVLSDASDSEVLVEAMDEWRRDHQDRSLRLEHLAVILARWNITVYRIDLGHNECPPNSIPHVSALLGILLRAQAGQVAGNQGPAFEEERSQFRQNNQVRREAFRSHFRRQRHHCRVGCFCTSRLDVEICRDDFL